MEAFSSRIAHPVARGKYMSRFTFRVFGFLPVVFLALTWTASPSLAVVGGVTDLSEFSDPASPYYGMNWDYNYATRGGTSMRG